MGLADILIAHFDFYGRYRNRKSIVARASSSVRGFRGRSGEATERVLFELEELKGGTEETVELI